MSGSLTNVIILYIKIDILYALFKGRYQNTFSLFTASVMLYIIIDHDPFTFAKVKVNICCIIQSMLAKNKFLLDFSVGVVVKSVFC